MSLPFIPTACETSETWVYCLFPPCWRLWGFLCGFMWGELCFRMFANADVVMSIVYFCICVRVWERVGSVLLNFQRIQTVHTLLQHITLWHPVLGIVHAVLTQLSPSLLHFPLLYTENFPLLLNTHFFCRRLHFIGTTLLRGCFSKGHKLVIIQSWKSLLDQWILLPQSLSFILDDSFFFLNRAKG